MDLILYLCLAGLFIAVLLSLFIFRKSGSKPKDRNDGGHVARPARIRQAEMAGGIRRGARRHMVVGQRHDDDDEDVDVDEPEIEPLFDESGQPKKIGAKKMRKLQEKAERRAQREAEEEERRERKRQQELREQLEKKNEEQRKAEAAVKEEEEARRREEQERREYEEYLKLKETFTVEEEGTHEDELNEDSESMLQKFINYIKDMKVVMLEDLAGHFKIKTQDAIDRINTLLEESKLSGVLDDRGKFIFITEEEYQAVAKFIKQRGRVSITELAESSNKLINLNPENLDTHKKLVSEVA